MHFRSYISNFIPITRISEIRVVKAECRLTEQNNISIQYTDKCYPLLENEIMQNISKQYSH